MTTDNINQIVDNLISTSPRAPNSFVLQIDTDNKTPKKCFEALCVIFTTCMRKLYGNSEGFVDIATILPEQLETVVKHFLSFGIVCQIDIEDNNFGFQNVTIHEKHTNDISGYWLFLPKNKKLYSINFQFYTT